MNARSRLLSAILVAIFCFVATVSAPVAAGIDGQSSAKVSKKKKSSKKKKKCKKGYKRVKGKCKKVKKPTSVTAPTPGGGTSTPPPAPVTPPPNPAPAITDLVVDSGTLGGTSGNWDIEVTVTTNGAVATTPIKLTFADSSASKDVIFNFSSTAAGAWNSHYASLDTFPAFIGTVTVTAKAGSLTSAPKAITVNAGL